LAGITTIRASNAQNKMIQEFNNHSDYHTQAYFAFMSANRWLAIRLDSVVYHNNIRFRVHFCCNWEYYIRRIRKLLDHFTLNSNDNPIYIH
jgi:hypothetical protein